MEEVVVAVVEEGCEALAAVESDVVEVAVKCRRRRPADGEEHDEASGCG